MNHLARLVIENETPRPRVVRVEDDTLMPDEELEIIARCSPETPRFRVIERDDATVADREARPTAVHGHVIREILA